MVQEEALVPVLDALNELGVPYMLVGAIACNYYAVPRLTHGADMVLELCPDRIAQLCERLEKDFYIDAAQIQDAIRHRSQFSLIHHATYFKIDCWLVQGDGFSQTRFARRLEGRIFGRTTFLTTAEDLILVKLQWFQDSGSEKHYTDALNVYRMQKEHLDRDHIGGWAKRLGLNDLWARLQREAER